LEAAQRDTQAWQDALTASGTRSPASAPSR
jgi:hypothetical protein